MLRRLTALLALVFAAVVLVASPAMARTQIEPEGEGSFPAPRITAVAAPDAASTTTTVPTTSTPRDLPGTTVEVANEGDGDSAAPWLIGSGIAAAVAIAIGGTILKRRQG